MCHMPPKLLSQRQGRHLSSKYIEQLPTKTTFKHYFYTQLEENMFYTNVNRRRTFKGMLPKRKFCFIFKLQNDGRRVRPLRSSLFVFRLEYAGNVTHTCAEAPENWQRIDGDIP